jgi:hypothetical protein
LLLNIPFPYKKIIKGGWHITHFSS